MNKIITNLAKNKIFVSGLVVIPLIFAATPVFAAEIVGPDGSNGNLVIGSGQIHKNLYTVGGNVTINADTAGDLTAAGGMVVITGKVENQLLLAGGTLMVSAPIGGTARIAGGNITISSVIGGDLVVAGGNVTLAAGSSVAGDLLIAGGNVIVDGSVGGNIRAVGGNITLNGKVGGDVSARASKMLAIDSGAEIAGKISYTGPQAAVVASGAKVGQIDFTQKKERGFGPQFLTFLSIALLIKFLAILIAAFLLITYRKNKVQGILEEVKANFWQSLGLGLAGLILTPIVVVLLFVTVVGYYLAIILGLVYVLALIITTLVSVICLGNLILSRIKKGEALWANWQVVLVGALGWLLLSFIPFLGWLVIAALYLTVFGVMIKGVKPTFKNN